MKPDHVCQHLRTKKMFIPAQAAEAFSPPAEEQGSPHCWCVRTMTEVGPDDRQVGLEMCNPHRRCFSQ